LIRFRLNRISSSRSSFAVISEPADDSTCLEITPSLFQLEIRYLARLEPCEHTHSERYHFGQ